MWVYVLLELFPVRIELLEVFGAHVCVFGGIYTAAVLDNYVIEGV